jgi:hypothetical protein
MIRLPIGREMARTAIIAGTATAVSGRVARRHKERYAAADQAAGPPSEPNPEPAASSPRRIDP